MHTLKNILTQHIANLKMMNIDMKNEFDMNQNKAVVVDLTTTVPEIATTVSSLNADLFSLYDEHMIYGLLSEMQNKLEQHNLASRIYLDDNGYIGYIDVLHYNSDKVIFTYVLSLFEFINDINEGYTVDYLSDILINDLIESVNSLN